MNEIPSLSVSAIVEKLAAAYSKLIKGGVPLKNFPSVMLWGAPGVGKSQAIRQVAEKLKSETGKNVAVTDVRLLLFNPIDLRGIPTANADKTLAVWLKPKIFDMDESENTVNILFLDEISAAPQSVQAAAYQITLDRVVGEHRLPDNCIVVAAGNRVTDKSVAYKMPRALANRLMHLGVDVKFESWREWAMQSGINDRVLGFLSYRPDLLIEEPKNPDELAYPSPRSWEMVSNILNYAESDPSKAFDLVAGVIGTGCAVEFRNWCKVYAILPSMEDIFAGKNPPVPAATDVLFALVSSMAVYARERKNDMKLLQNSIRYALRFPADFSALLMRDYMSIEKGFKERLMLIPEFYEWLRTKGRFLNGN